MLAVLLNPVMPKASAVLWDSLGAEPTLGALADQRIDAVAAWGQLPAGATITKPRVAVPAHRGRGRVTLTEGWPEAPEPLPSPVVDNHCHLDHRAYAKGVEGGLLIPVDEALDRAAAVGVTRVVQVGCDLEGSRWAVETAEAYDSVIAAVALHPNEAPKHAELGDLDEALAEIDALAQSPYVRAVGETGLDYFRTGEAGREAQHASFREHIRMAKRHDKTLVIHDRDAHDDVLAVLDDEGITGRVRSCTASPATPTSRASASTAGPTCRSPARSPSRTLRTSAKRSVSRHLTVSLSRPMRLSSHPRRIAGARTLRS